MLTDDDIWKIPHWKSDHASFIGSSNFLCKDRFWGRAKLTSKRESLGSEIGRALLLSFVRWKHGIPMGLRCTVRGQKELWHPLREEARGYIRNSIYTKHSEKLASSLMAVRGEAGNDFLVRTGFL